MNKNSTELLSKLQQSNGSFLFFNKDKISSTALAILINPNKRALDFLTSQNNNWKFSENVSTNFLAISAIAITSPEILNGTTLAKILIDLTNLEENEGGPYRNTEGEVDVLTNISIAYFLSLNKVTLPNLEKLIEQAIDENLRSLSVRDKIVSCFILSKIYKGNKKKNLLKIISDLEGLDEIEKVLKEETITNLNSEELKKDKFTKDEQELYQGVLSDIKDLCDGLEGDLKKQTIRAFDMMLKNDSNKEMVLLPYFFSKSLKKKNDVPKEVLRKLGIANLCLWVTFTLYDDFFDEEGDPKTLPSSNLCFRIFTEIYTTLLPKESGFLNIFNEIMNGLEGANAWETANCRAELSGLKLQVPKKLPEYENYERLYGRSLALAMGPVAILSYLGYKEDSSEIENIIKFFQNFLVARQLNDDMHDWEEDLKNGHLDSVVCALLKDWKKETIELRDNSDINKLKEIFWFNHVVEINEIALEYIDKAKKYLRRMDSVEDYAKIERFLEPTEYSSKRAIFEQQEANKLIKTFS